MVKHKRKIIWAFGFIMGALNGALVGIAAINRTPAVVVNCVVSVLVITFVSPWAAGVLEEWISKH